MKPAERERLKALGRELAATWPPLPDRVIEQAAALYVAMHAAKEHGRGRDSEGAVMVALAKGARVVGMARSALAADYKAKYDKGRSIRSIAEETGRSYGFVHRMLSEAGVRLRPRGGSYPGGRRRAR